MLELMHITSADGVTPPEGRRLQARQRGQEFRPADRPVASDRRGLPQDLRRVQGDDAERHAAKRAGSLDFDVDSFAASRGGPLEEPPEQHAMVVDLGPFPRLITIKGNFDAKKGSEAGYVGDPARSCNFAAPQLELSDALEKAKDILQILAALQGGDYVGAFKRGLKIAMSNRRG